jgi:hypothetical protein
MGSETETSFGIATFKVLGNGEIKMLRVLKKVNNSSLTAAQGQGPMGSLEAVSNLMLGDHKKVTEDVM